MSDGEARAAVFNKTLGSRFTFSSRAPEMVNIVSGWTCVRRVHSYSQANGKKLNKLQLERGNYELHQSTPNGANEMRLEKKPKKAIILHT